MAKSAATGYSDYYRQTSRTPGGAVPATGSMTTGQGMSSGQGGGSNTPTTQPVRKPVGSSGRGPTTQISRRPDVTDPWKKSKGKNDDEEDARLAAIRRRLNKRRKKN